MDNSIKDSIVDIVGFIICDFLNINISFLVIS